MNIQFATDEYNQALRAGQKEFRELSAAGQPTHPAVLDELLPENGAHTVVDVGLIEIPSERIIGTKSAGRIAAFTPSFHPLLDPKSEFAAKWINLCAAHLGETGITDPIACYEYLGNFYVQEGNKRVSVLRCFGAPRIPGQVRRVMPAPSEDPRIRAYYEFLDFYKVSHLYTIQFRRPGDYAKLLGYLGKKGDEVWTEDERRTFNAYFHYFRDAFLSLNTRQEDVLPCEALLLWLALYPYKDLGRLTTGDLRKSIADLWEDMVASSKDDGVKVQTKAEDETKASIVSRLVSGIDVLHVALIHQLNPAQSAWVLGHEDGRNRDETADQSVSAVSGKQCRKHYDGRIYRPEEIYECGAGVCLYPCAWCG